MGDIGRPYRRRGARRWRRLAVSLLTPVLLAPVLLTGCATVPTGGPVQSGRAVGRSDPLTDPYVRLMAPRPQPGWDPRTIVQGFLTASAGLDGGDAVAREYLTSALSKQWNPGAGVTVYDATDGFTLGAGERSGHTATVTMSARQVAQIGGDGDYTATKSRSLPPQVFKLRRSHGQWRIAGLPSVATSGLLLSSTDVSRAFRSLNLYFYDPHIKTLVPDPVLVPVQSRSGLAAALVRGLLRGPTAWMAQAVRSAIPSGTKLRGKAPLAGGTVTVDLSNRGGRSWTGRQLAQLSAQLVWTLKQLPEMQQLRLEVNGRQVNVPGSTGSHGLQRRDDWPKVDPSGGSEVLHAYFSRQGSLWVTAGHSADRAPGPAGEAGAGLYHPAISLDGERRVAGLSADGGTLFAGGLSGDGKLSVRRQGKQMTPPSWDRYNNLWTAQRGGSAIWMLRDGKGGKKNAVRVPGLSGYDIAELRVARDGCRVAVVVGTGGSSRLLVAPIIRDGGSPRIGQPRRLGDSLDEISDVAWRDADTLAVLGKGPRGAEQPYLVSVGSTSTTPTGYAGSPASTIAAAPGSGLPLLVGSSNGTVWSGTRNSVWQSIGSGSDPAYPG